MARIAALPATALAAWRNCIENKTYAGWAELYDVPVPTFWHRVHARPSRSDTAVNRQYLTSSEENVLVNYVLSMAARGYFDSVKFLRYLAHWIVCQPSSTFQIPTIDNEAQTPDKNWPPGLLQTSIGTRTEDTQAA